jgi:ATP-dependent RNA helicase DDX46/PRP5
MARRDRSHSPETSNKRVRSSHRSSPRSPSPTRRSIQRTSNRSRYDDDRRDRERDRPRDRERDRHRDDRYRDDRRRDSYRDDRRDERRRSRSRDYKDRDRHPPAIPTKSTEPISTPPPEDDKVKDRRAKLEAWKKEREAKKALDEAKAKAMALAGKTAPREFFFLIAA